MVKKNNKGISVVELVIAIAVFSLISTVAYQSFFSIKKLDTQKTLEHKAYWLAHEGVEATHGIIRDDFENVSDGVSGLGISGGNWVLSGGSDVVDDFTRTVEIETIDVDTKIASSTVTWDFEGTQRFASLQEVVTYWNQEVVTSDGLDINTLSANINGSNLRSIFLSSLSSSTVTIISIEISWTKSGRVLNRIRSPQNITVFGPASVTSGSTVPLNLNIGLIPQEIRFLFDKNMNNSSFTITFNLSNGDSVTVNI